MDWTFSKTKNLGLCYCSCYHFVCVTSTRQEKKILMRNRRVIIINFFYSDYHTLRKIWNAFFKKYLNKSILKKYSKKKGL